MIRYYFICFLVLVFMSCSDGTQTVTKINEIINSEDYNIHTVVIEIKTEGGASKILTIPSDSLVIENQFIKTNGQYINIGAVRTFSIDNNQLEIIL